MTKIDLKPCPNPWCDAPESHPPMIQHGHFGTRYVSCSYCTMKGPVAQCETSAALAWNNRGYVTISSVDRAIPQELAMQHLHLVPHT